MISFALSVLAILAIGGSFALILSELLMCKVRERHDD